MAEKNGGKEWRHRRIALKYGIKVLVVVISSKWKAVKTYSTVAKQS